MRRERIAKSNTPSISVTIGRQTRLYHAFVTTAPAALDAPSTVTLHAGSLRDVATFAFDPFSLDAAHRITSPRRWRRRSKTLAESSIELKHPAKSVRRYISGTVENVPIVSLLDRAVKKPASRSSSRQGQPAFAKATAGNLRWIMSEGWWRRRDSDSPNTLPVNKLRQNTLYRSRRFNQKATSRYKTGTAIHQEDGDRNDSVAAYRCS